jgi:hypothetical protein
VAATPYHAVDDDEMEWAGKEQWRLHKDVARLAPVILAGIGEGAPELIVLRLKI